MLNNNSKDVNGRQKASTLLETQMTHFPALAPEADDVVVAPKNQTSSSGGIINSVKSFFRSTSNIPPTNNINNISLSPESELTDKGTFCKLYLKMFKKLF